MPPKTKSRTSAKSSLNNSIDSNPVDTVQNAIRAHQVRQSSLERQTAQTPNSNKPPSNKRTTWTSDQRNALKTLQSSIASHNVRQEFLSKSDQSNEKVTNVQIALKSHKIRQDTIDYNR